jgi:hypothetical protein
MALDWLRNNKTAAEDQQELELKPAEVKAQLDKLNGFETKFTELTTSTKAITDWIAQQDALKVAAARKAQSEADAARVLEAENNKPDLFTQPDAYMAAALDPLKANQVNMASLLMRREILDDAAFEYYTGDVKKTIDTYIDGLPLSHRADPASIKNCYYTVIGQKQAELKEGKLKSRYAAASTSASGTGGTSATQTETVTLNDEQKAMAAKFGMKEEDYAKKFKEYAYV